MADPPPRYQLRQDVRSYGTPAHILVNLEKISYGMCTLMERKHTLFKRFVPTTDDTYQGSINDTDTMIGEILCITIGKQALQLVDIFPCI